MDVFCVILVISGCGYAGYRKYQGKSICPKVGGGQGGYGQGGNGRTSSSSRNRLDGGNARGTPAVSKILHCYEDLPDKPDHLKERGLLFMRLYKAIVSTALEGAQKREAFSFLPSRFQFVPTVAELDALLQDRMEDVEGGTQTALDPHSSGLMVRAAYSNSSMPEEAQGSARSRTTKFNGEWAETWQNAPRQDEHFKHTRGVNPTRFFALSYMHFDRHQRSTSKNGEARFHPRTLAALKQQPIYFGGIEAPSKLWHDGCRHYGDGGLWGPVTGLMFYTAAASTVLKVVDDHAASEQLWLYSFGGIPEEKFIVKLIDTLTGINPLPDQTICGLDVKVKLKGLLPPPVRIGGTDRFWMLAEMAIGITKDGITTTIPQAAQIVYTLAWFRQLAEVIGGSYEELTDDELRECCKTQCCQSEPLKVKLYHTDCMGSPNWTSPKQKIFRKVLHELCKQNGLDPSDFARSVTKRVERLARLWALVFLRGTVKDESIIRGEILEPMLDAHVSEESDRMPIYFLLEYMITAVFDEGCHFSQAIHEYNGFGRKQPMKALSKIMDRKFGFRVTMPLQQRLDDFQEWFGLYDTHATEVVSPQVIFHTWTPVTDGRCFAGVITSSSFKGKLRNYINLFNKKEKAQVKWSQVARLLEGSKSQLVLLRGEGVRAWIHGEHPIVVLLMGSVRDSAKRRRAAPGWGDPIATATRIALKAGDSQGFVPLSERSMSTSAVHDVRYRWVLEGNDGGQEILNDDDMIFYQFVFDFSRLCCTKKSSRKAVKHESKPPALHLLTFRNCGGFEGASVLPISTFDLQTGVLSRWKDQEVKRLDVTLRMAAGTAAGFKDCSMEYWQLYDEPGRSPIAPRGSSMDDSKPWYDGIITLKYGDLAHVLRSTAWCDGSCGCANHEEIPEFSEQSSSSRSVTSHTQSVSSDTSPPVSPIAGEPKLSAYGRSSGSNIYQMSFSAQ